MPDKNPRKPQQEQSRGQQHQPQQDHGTKDDLHDCGAPRSNRGPMNPSESAGQHLQQPGRKAGRDRS